MCSKNTTISFRPLKMGDEPGVVGLVLKVFTEFVAPLYSEQGVEAFKKFVCADSFADRVKAGNVVLLAESGRKIIGVIEMRENSHIALLFVEKSYQRKGIAKKLFQRSIEICKKKDPDIKCVTVNSSPNAFVAYKKLGFKSIADEKVVNGIRFIPMQLLFGNGCGSRPVNSCAP